MTASRKFSNSVNAKGKERLILDLDRHVNQNVILYNFKFKGIKDALILVQKDGFMLRFDLSSGYHHIFFFIERGVVDIV